MPGGVPLATRLSTPEERDSANRALTSHRAVRWLEYSGSVVVLAVLAEAQPSGVTVSDFLGISGLCNATLYSALSICLALELVRVDTVKECGRRVKRYRLTEKGSPVGDLALSLEHAMIELPPFRRLPIQPCL